MNFRPEHGVLVGIVALSGVLVLGRHFDAPFAGGAGYRPRVDVVTTLIEGNGECSLADVSRDGVVTCTGQRKIITFGSSTLWMDERTDFAVVNNREGLEAVASHGGRSVVSGPVAVHLRDGLLSTTGTMSLVDYSWLNSAEVYAISGDVTVDWDGEVATISEGSAVRFDTLAPYDDAEDISYAFEHGSAAEFYEWVGRNE